MREFEFQEIRYAVSYAKIKTTDELVDKMFASYIEKYKDEFELGDLTAYEKATRILGMQMDLCKSNLSTFPTFLHNYLFFSTPKML